MHFEGLQGSAETFLLLLFRLLLLLSSSFYLMSATHLYLRLRSFFQFLFVAMCCLLFFIFILGCNYFFIFILGCNYFFIYYFLSFFLLFTIAFLPFFSFSLPVFLLPPSCLFFCVFVSSVCFLSFL